MIARIQGKIIQKSESRIIIDNHGIGYEILIPFSTYYELPDLGSDVNLSIYTYYKQDAILLAGFYTEKEKNLFKLMISITGIGPKLAINILSGISSDEFITAVINKDLSRFLKVPGLGKKIAERLILELRDKIKEEIPEEKLKQSDDDAVYKRNLEVDAISALVNLGYKSQAAKEVIDRVISKEGGSKKSFDMILKESLKILAL